MSTYVGYRDSGKTNEQGLKEELNRLFTAGVTTGDTATALQVTQRGAGANMSVDIAIGDCHIVRPDATYSYWCWQDAVSNATVSASNVTNPRIDAVVAWLDLSVTSATNSNNPGALKFSVIAGTPAGSPVAPTNSAIQTALGATVPWVPLANIAVAANATQVVNANITDLRAGISIKTGLAAASVTTAAIATNAVAANHLSTSAIKLGTTISTSLSQTGFSAQTDITGMSVTVTVPAGGRDILITGQVTCSWTITSDEFRLQINEGATILAANQQTTTAGKSTTFYIALPIVAPTAGSHTYKLTGVRVSGTGTMAPLGAAGIPAFITVTAT